MYKSKISCMFLVMTSFIILIGVTSCQEGYSGWYPDRVEEIKHREAIIIPSVRFKHDLKGVPSLDVVIGKAFFRDVEYGQTTKYKRSEEGNVPVWVYHSSLKKFFPVRAISETIGGTPLERQKRYTLVLRYNSKGKMEYRTIEDTETEERLNFLNF